MLKAISCPKRAAWFASLLTSLFCISSLAVADETNCKFAECDHSIPEVRRVILDLAQSYVIRQEDEAAENILVAAIQIWQKPAQIRDLESACMRLLRILSLREILKERASLLSGCPKNMVVVSDGRLNHVAIPTMRMLPVFSGAALRKDRVATVIVAYEVSKRGGVRKVKILESSYPKINSAIKRATRKATFIPAVEAGVAVASLFNRLTYVVHIEGGVAQVEFIEMVGGLGPNPAE